MNPNFPLDLHIHPSTVTKAIGNHTPDATGVLDDPFGVQAQQDAISIYGIAGRVWEAAYAIVAYLHPASTRSFDPPPFVTDRSRPLSILELGSGTGMVASCVAALLDATDLLIATDLPEVCPLLENNLRLHAGLAVRPLSWGNMAHVDSLKSEFLSSGRRPHLTHIICSDLIYFPELFAPLLRSLLHLTSVHSKPEGSEDPYPIVIISYMVRSLAKETPFWAAFGLWFDFRPVLTRTGGEGSFWQRFGSTFDDPTFIFVAQRRPESQSWIVPVSDEDLIHGVGANATLSSKSDSTFESLLLLSLDEDFQS